MQFIVNHGGVVQVVNDEELDLHIGMASIPPSKEDPRGKPARMATAEEIDRWFRSQGLDNPNAPSSEPDATDKPAKK